MLQTETSQYVRCSSLPIGWRRNWHLSLNYLVWRAQPKLPAFSVCLSFSTAIYGCGSLSQVVSPRCVDSAALLRQENHREIYSQRWSVWTRWHYLTFTFNWGWTPFFFLLCWNLRETSTSSHTDKIFSSARITVYERWIVSIPGKHLKYSLVKLFKWISGWFSNLMVSTSLVNLRLVHN